MRSRRLIGRHSTPGSHHAATWQPDAAPMRGRSRVSHASSPRFLSFRAHNLTCPRARRGPIHGSFTRTGVVAEDVTPKLRRGAGAHSRGVVTRPTTPRGNTGPSDARPSHSSATVHRLRGGLATTRHGGVDLQTRGCLLVQPRSSRKATGLQPCRRAACATTSRRAQGQPRSSPLGVIRRRNPSERPHA